MSAILVVEDNEVLAEEIVESLADEGYQVFRSKSGQETFEALKAQDIKMVFLDIMLVGEIDGYEILRRLKTQEETVDIPVVMLSNLGQMKEIERAMEIGANDYIVKANIDLDELVAFAKKFIPQ